MDPTARDPLPITDYVAAIRRDGARLAAAATVAGPDAAVPSCPEWTVRDLLRHTGGVHRWATGIVGDVRTEPWNVELDEVVGTWPSDDELVGWFGDGVERLATTLASADPAVPCWSFLRAPSPLVMWARRQAHETAIHRVDGELAVGDVWPVAPSFATDGLDELLTAFIVRRKTGLVADPPRSLRVTTRDGDGDWTVRIGVDGARTSTGDGPNDPDGAADCAVHGGASDLYLTLWNRQEARDLDVTGDGDVLELFLDRVHVRW